MTKLNKKVEVKIVARTPVAGYKVAKSLIIPAVLWIFHGGLGTTDTKAIKRVEQTVIRGVFDKWQFTFAGAGVVLCNLVGDI